MWKGVAFFGPAKQIPMAPLLPLPLLLLLLLLLLSPCIVSTAPIRGSAEVSALMKLKASLDPDGSFLSSWTADGDPCAVESFEGVGCNEQGNVANISLQGMGLRGSISPAVAELKSLSGLFLHYNDITGEIPKEIGGLAQLSDLYLNVNNISGSVPAEIAGMVSLQVLQICCNQLTGNIPNELGRMTKLTVVSLQSNLLTGAIPASLGTLAQLARLDLSFNRLFGSIPVKIAQLPDLAILDVRNNSLSGTVPSELSRLEGGFFYGNNSDLCGTGFFSLRSCTEADLLSPSRPEPYGPNATDLTQRGIPQSANVNGQCNTTNCQNSSNSAIPIVVGISIIVFVGAVVGLLVFICYRLRKQKFGNFLEVSDTSLSTHEVKNLYGKGGSPLISLEYAKGWDPLADGRSEVGFSEELSQSLRFNVEEVEFATQYFSEINLLGRSNFSATYKGILRDGSVVVVKCISKISCKSEEAKFLKGLKMLTSLQHDNLVRLRGFCCSRGRGECFFVYDFVANGSLSRYLDVKGERHGGSILDWPTRVAIIKGIAEGIVYLHTSKPSKPPLVHQNISTDQVLIDHHFKPLISGSGFHKMLTDDVIFSTLKATAAMGYLAPEYASTGRFTEKSDVYAFGVIIFQLLAGKQKITHLKVSDASGKLDEMIDPNLHNNYYKPEAVKLASIALICTSESPNQRPTMEDILEELSIGRS